MVGIRVLMEGMQALPRDNDVSHDTVELEERKGLFKKSKGPSDKIPRGKNSGVNIARDCFDCYRCHRLKLEI